jgi:hypothetical protein
MKRVWLPLGFVLVMSSTIGCEDKSKTTALAPSASALSSSVAAPSQKLQKFEIDAKSRVTFDMPAPKERIKGQAQGASGTVTVDTGNLGNTRGEIKVDLAALATSTFGDKGKDDSQTEHARTWLEVAEKLPAEQRGQNRHAVFAIRSIEGIATPELAKVELTKDGDTDVRVVSCTAVGELLLHGHKVDKRLELEVKFRYAPGAKPGAMPVSFDLKTRTPLKVTLAEHDVKPRDDVGKIAKGAFSLLGTKVADVADVTLEFKALAVM